MGKQAELKKYMLNVYGKSYQVSLKKSTYLNNKNLYVGLDVWEDDYPEPWSDLTVNLDEICEPDCAFIDTNNNGDAIIKWIIENGIGELTGRMGFSGFCVYPEVRFKKEILDEIPNIA